LAVTVILPFNVTLQVTVLDEVQPVHDKNALPLEFAGAVNTSCVPAAAVCVKLVVPTKGSMGGG
jgi:hypothetical protein